MHAALALVWAGASAAVFAAADPVAPSPPGFGYTPLEPGTYHLETIQRAADAKLLDASGRSVRLSAAVTGKVTLLTFFYTYCTDTWGCPYAYRLMTELREKLSADPAVRAQVRFVSVSFDPKNDTPEALRLYSGALTAQPDRLEWRFLTAPDMRTLVPLLEDFGQDVEIERDAGGRPTRTRNHMLKLFLIDRAGFVREIYALDTLYPAQLANDVLTLVREGARGRTTAAEGRAVAPRR
jgi:cytochrome oxidase Cu insertion factor (SCO1/SenC/PrrC family)